MTAEVAILNKSAVALAADSTVTISPSGRNRKTYHTANKLFTLSKYHPVGAMIFGNAEIMGVPWETILKQYRAQLLKNVFPTISDYTEDFLQYLRRSVSDFFPESQQRRYFWLTAYRFFLNVKADIEAAQESAGWPRQLVEAVREFRGRPGPIESVRG